MTCFSLCCFSVLVCVPIIWNWNCRITQNMHIFGAKCRLHALLVGPHLTCRHVVYVIYGDCWLVLTSAFILEQDDILYSCTAMWNVRVYVLNIERCIVYCKLHMFIPPWYATRCTDWNAAVQGLECNVHKQAMRSGIVLAGCHFLWFCS